jgi:CDP-paratose synthetase
LRIAAGINEKYSKRVRFISVGSSIPSNLNLYSLTKKQFSEIGIFFHQLRKIEFVNLLLESFYGIDEPHDRFITNSILKLKSNQELPLTEGIQKRDYILIDDVIEILFFLLDCDLSSGVFHSEITIPVGSGISPSIKEIILFLHGETKSSSSLLFGAKPMRENEPSTVANLSMLRSIGFNKKITPWKDGMRKVIKGLS